MYVVEGSRLGGKLISHHLNKTLGITPTEGERFFAGTGSGGPEHWKAFRPYCKAFVKQYPETRDEIIGSANTTFRFIQDYFEQAYLF
jgi:heme oxygenase (biliverdin-IX-beta and delta-forming)